MIKNIHANYSEFLSLKFGGNIRWDSKSQAGKWKSNMLVTLKRTVYITHMRAHTYTHTEETMRREIVKNSYLRKRSYLVSYTKYGQWDIHMLFSLVL